MSAKVFLTGGTGFFGKSLLRYIKQVGLDNLGIEELTLMSRDPNKFKFENLDLSEINGVRFIKGDVLNPDSFQYDRKYTHVIHAATESTNGPKLDPSKRFYQILNGTQNILDFTEKVGAFKFLLTSSGGVYGEVISGQNIHEECPTSPDVSDESMSYSIGKLAAEHITFMWAQKYGRNVIIARCFAFIGQDLPQDVHFAAGNFIRSALKNDDIEIATDGSSVRSYMHQNDLAEWLLTLLLSVNSKGIYNVGSDEPVSILNLAKMIAEISNGGKSKVICKSSRPPQNRRFYVPSVDKAKKELGLSLKYSLRSSIEETLKHCKDRNV